MTLIGAIAAANREPASPTQTSVGSCSQWMVIPSPNVNTFGSLGGVAGDMPGDLWVVGNYTDPSSGLARSLTEHWNGSVWSIVASPNVGSVDNILWSVAAVATNNVWAAGETDSGGNPQPLIEHWDGTNWAVVPSANPGPQGSQFYGVAARAGAGHPWTVGYLYLASGYAPLTENWNGSMWAYVRAPAQPPYSGLNAVTVIPRPGAPNGADVWAVGNASDGTPQGRHALFLRYQPFALGIACQNT